MFLLEVSTFQPLRPLPVPLTVLKMWVFSWLLLFFEFVLLIIPLQVRLENWNLVCKFNRDPGCTWKGSRLFSYIEPPSPPLLLIGKNSFFKSNNHIFIIFHENQAESLFFFFKYWQHCLTNINYLPECYRKGYHLHKFAGSSLHEMLW